MFVGYPHRRSPAAPTGATPPTARSAEAGAACMSLAISAHMDFRVISEFRSVVSGSRSQLIDLRVSVRCSRVFVVAVCGEVQGFGWGRGGAAYSCHPYG